MKIGFEIHQQLETKKLFCSSPSILRDDEAEYEVKRRLRPSQSELGVIDEAAMKEFKKAKTYIYKGYNDSICLVELDEEPPRGPNEEAVNIAITMALMLNATIVDEIHFMRKMVIDGSNTSGFQRTAIIAFDGFLDTSEGRIKIPTIILEEEAARKVAEEDDSTTYNLDRLGIPLVEITTDPDIRSPRMARDAALRVGELLRATGKVKRGIGTIRQDINVSIEGGARSEIKGVQELNIVPKLIETEVNRQSGLIKIKKKLIDRGITRDVINSPMHDLTSLFSSTSSKIVRNQIKNGVVYGIKLQGFDGLLGGGLLGREIARYVRVQTGLKGIFHSDELPAYGVSNEEVRSTSKQIGIKKEDAFVLVAGEKNRVKNALSIVLNRSRKALVGPLEETRMARGSESDYMRPLPGAARMYPETDILPYVISNEKIKEIKNNLPETYEESEKRLFKTYGISSELAGPIIRKGYTPFFEDVAGNVEYLPTTTAASIILDSSKYLVERSIDEEGLKNIILAVDEGKFTKEAIPDILEDLKQGKTFPEIIQERSTGEIDLESLIDKLISEKTDFIREKGVMAQKPLMGLVMKEARGRIDGKLVNEILKKKIKQILSH